MIVKVKTSVLLYWPRLKRPKSAGKIIGRGKHASFCYAEKFIGSLIGKEVLDLRGFVIGQICSATTEYVEIRLWEHWFNQCWVPDVMDNVKSDVCRRCNQPIYLYGEIEELPDTIMYDFSDSSVCPHCRGHCCGRDIVSQPNITMAEPTIMLG